MASELLVSVPFPPCNVHSVEIYRFKQGPDHIYVRTNMPNPMRPHVGGWTWQTMVDRGSAPELVKRYFPDVEVHFYDATIVTPRDKRPLEALALG